MTALAGLGQVGTTLYRGVCHRTRPLLPNNKRRAAPCAAAKETVEAVVPDQSFGLVARNAEFFRALPLYAGGLGVASLLLNRALSGIAPVVDASSSQSRADVLGIVLSAVLLLTGLQWLSLKPRQIAAVDLDGTTVNYVDPGLKPNAALLREFEWARDAMFKATRCKSLVLIYKGRNLFHYGYILRGRKPGEAAPGDICNDVMRNGRGNYLANLLLYPGRPEFTAFLPENTQGVVLQPVGEAGVLVAGTDTVRGFSRLDQAWLATIADKLEVSLGEVALPQTGVGFGGARPGGAAGKR
ncbi:hypothetical protein PLESTB_000022600 [Pleodorina starrii]|uniref:Uncharacterized protein n=1 Tax=Pleodorina starrii TaxID=330485 RepID=A0A9W6EVK3_9CHLO|nr:hypothetical protein PLESTM_001112200 [Pleodorina starrii]GLC47758.1 hypothetical protein PLESTB_000022600 [Pleodorina starrii]GLC70828.1 hypothetical protein PLESTF_001037400 [Pleodorina starrii]